MQDIKARKSFFVNNNKLNKGYHADDISQEEGSSLLNVNVMAEYESIQPGTLSRIIEMTAREQENRHVLEMTKFKLRKSMIRLNRMFSFLFFVVISYVAMSLFMLGMKNEAIIFTSLSFISMVMLFKRRGGCKCGSDCKCCRSSLTDATCAVATTDDIKTDAKKPQYRHYKKFYNKKK
jgi:uncharacterized membrane protein